MTEPLRSAVVYYTLTGNTRSIAEAIAAEIGADLIELKTRRDMRKLGILAYVIEGFQAIFKITPALVPLDKVPGDHDVLFIGTPVWASRLAPAVRALLKRFRIVDRKMAFFCCCSPGGAGNTLDDLELLLADNEVLDKTEFVDASEPGSEENAARAADWARSLLADQ